MGSLSGVGVPVVTKSSLTYRAMDNKIESTNSVGDVVTAIDGPAPPVRTISSGSIVRDNGDVEYREDLVYGGWMMGRSSTARIASDTGNVRTPMVDLGDNQTDAVMIPALSGVTPLLAHRHLGERIHKSRTDTDTVIERVPNSGVYDDGFPL